MDHFLRRIKQVSLWRRAIVWALVLGIVFAFGRAFSNGTSITVGYIVSNLAPWLLIGAPLYAILMALMGRRED